MLNYTIQLSGKYTNSVQIRTNFQVDRKGYLDFYFIPETLLNTSVVGNIAISDQQKAPNVVKTSSPLLSEEAGWSSFCHRNCLQNNQTKAAPYVRISNSFILKHLSRFVRRLTGYLGDILNLVFVEQYLFYFFFLFTFLFASLTKAVMYSLNKAVITYASNS